LEISPQCQKAIFQTAVIFYRKGQWEKSISILDQFLEIRKDYQPAYQIKGECFYSMDKLWEAYECLKMASLLGPTVNTIFYFGQVLESLGNLKEAGYQFLNLVDLEVSIERHLQLKEYWLNEFCEEAPISERYYSGPNHKGILLEVDGFLVKGILCYKYERIREGIQWLDKVLQINPNHLDAIVHKAIALTHLGKEEEALEVMEKVEQISPSEEIKEDYEEIFRDNKLT